MFAFELQTYSKNLEQLQESRQRSQSCLEGLGSLDHPSRPTTPLHLKSLVHASIPGDLRIWKERGGGFNKYIVKVCKSSRIQEQRTITYHYCTILASTHIIHIGVHAIIP